MHRLRLLARRVLLTSWRAAAEFVEDRGHRDAAQIGFFAVLSAVPLAILLVGAFGLVFEEADVRERVITTAFDAVPVVQEADRTRLEGAVRSALDDAGSVGAVSIVLLLVAATGVMGALRHSGRRRLGHRGAPAAAAAQGARPRAGDGRDRPAARLALDHRDPQRRRRGRRRGGGRPRVPARAASASSSPSPPSSR